MENNLNLPSILDSLVAQTSGNSKEIFPLMKSSRATVAKELTPEDMVLFLRDGNVINQFSLFLIYLS